MNNIKLPITKESIKELRAGDSVLLSGKIYTARDAAHKRMIDALDRNEALPFDIEGTVVYYAGPCPAKPGEVIGSCGPTTSYRMDAYAPRLISLGLGAMIGKGQRNDEVKEACVKHGCVYFGALGGGGALLAECVKKSEIVAYDDLGTEAVRCLSVENFPVTVIIDTLGNDLYDSGRLKYKSK